MQQRLVLRRIQERDDRSAFTQLRDFRFVRRPDLQHDVRVPRRGAIHDLRTGRRVLRVRKVRRFTGALFDCHLPSRLHPFSDHIGRRSNATFLGFCLLDNA